MPDALIVYGHPTCPGLGPVKGLLTQSKVKFEYIDIHRDSDAAARVRDINNGNESVPTLVFPDGSTLTEPTVGELKSKLESMGYKVGIVAWLIGNFWLIFFIVAGVLIAVLRFLGVF
jgi:mycoredoxin